eukprot:c43775_g1_i1 orf=3-176(-)
MNFVRKRQFDFAFLYSVSFRNKVNIYHHDLRNWFKSKSPSCQLDFPPAKLQLGERFAV